MPAIQIIDFPACRKLPPRWQPRPPEAQVIRFPLPSAKRWKVRDSAMPPEYTEIVKTLGGHPEGNGWACKCPAHDDRKPSLSVKVGDNGRLLVHCHAGCSQEDVIAALRQRGLWPEKRSEAPTSLGTIVATYDYLDEHGKVRLQVVKFEPKTFRQRRPNGSDGWFWNVTGIELVPYRLPELRRANPNRPIFIVEGEKDVDNLAKLGLTGTCNPMGAKKWQPEISRWLRGVDVVILGDNDEPGREHVADVAKKLTGIARRIRVLETMPGSTKKGDDVSDWIGRGGTAKALLELAEGLPDWTPPVEPQARANGEDTADPRPEPKPAESEADYQGAQGANAAREGLDQPGSGPGSGNGATAAGIVDELGEWDAGEDNEPIPPRPWLLGTIFCLGFLSSIFGQGGVGKTAVRLLQWLSVATGRPLLGDHVFRRMPVLIICLEDDRDEIRRRLKAARIHYGISAAELKGWLFIACPRGVKLADLTDVRVPIRGKLYEWTRAAILRRKPGLVTFDPFMKTHSLPENDNKAMDFVAELLTQMAIEFRVATDAPHHTKKGVMVAGDADAGRGAGSIKDDARLVYTLVRMTPREAEALNVPAGERRFLVRLDSGKVNLVPESTEARWFKLIGVNLGNGTVDYPNGDNVQTAEQWTAPEAWEGVNILVANEVLSDIDRGLPGGVRYSNHNRAGEREARHVVQRHLPEKSDKQARDIVAAWIKNETLYEEEYLDPVERKTRKGLRVNNAKRPGTTINA